jgi:hypothetical protein
MGRFAETAGTVLAVEGIERREGEEYFGGAWHETVCGVV